MGTKPGRQDDKWTGGTPYDTSDQRGTDYEFCLHQVCLPESPFISALQAKAAFYDTYQKTNLKTELNVLNGTVCARWDL
jgi:hypothetical protein